MQEKIISFIGCGNMGRSLIGGLIANGYPVQLIRGAEPDSEQRERTASLFNISLFKDSRSAVEDADVIVLAVKPQMIESVIGEFRDLLPLKQPVLISIAAGIRLASIKAAAGGDLPIVRVMPNTPSLIQAGAAALYANPFANQEHLETAESIMQSVGVTIWLDAEEKLDAVTALSGSGPAYFFLIMEMMEKIGVELGLEPEQARLLTLETAQGAAKMALESKIDPATLRQQVTSPGGTTAAALDVLIGGNIEALFRQALEAAKERSISLSDESSPGA